MLVASCMHLLYLVHDYVFLMSRHLTYPVAFHLSSPYVSLLGFLHAFTFQYVYPYSVVPSTITSSVLFYSLSYVLECTCIRILYCPYRYRNAIHYETS